jgi:hypothetical protein
MLNPSASIRTLEGVGDVTARVFELAGFYTIADISRFDRDDQKILDALDLLKQQRIGQGLPPLPRAYYRRLRSVCTTAVYCARDLHGTETHAFPPHQCQCPLTLDWLEYPVVTPEGDVYEKDAIVEWLQQNPTQDPFRVGVTIDANDLRSCRPLKEIVLLVRSGRLRRHA